MKKEPDINSLEKVVVSNKQFSQADIRLRRLLVRLQKVTFELSCLSRFAYFSAPKEKDDELFRRADNAQMMFMFRLICSKTHEAYVKIFDSGIFKNFPNEFPDELKFVFSDESIKQLLELREYIQARSYIGKIRNKFGFHYDFKAIEPSIENFDLDYISYIQGSGLTDYPDSAELIVNRSILNIIAQDDFDDPEAEIYKASGDLRNLIHRCCAESMIIDIFRVLKPEITDRKIEPLLRPKEIKTPYFMQNK